MSIKSFLWSVLSVLFLLGLQHNLFGQEQSQDKDEFQRLKEQVAELEATVATLKKQLVLKDHADGQDSASTEESELEKQLAQELGAEPSQSAPNTQAQTPQQTGGRPLPTYSARKSLFQSMNPNISVIGTILGTATSLEPVERNVNLLFQEAEFSFQAAVDPYAKADLFISFGKDFEEPLVPVPVAAEGDGGLSSEIEEGFVTLLSLPFSTQLKAGKFRSKFGKINETHPHAYNFINLPIVFTNFFGPEGLNDEGVSISWLTPNSAFFQELTVQVTSGPLDNNSFGRATDNHLLYLVHFKNLFDLNDNTTMELGLTGLTGPHNSEGQVTKIFGADLTFKWKPLRFNRYKSFEWMSEFLVSKRNGDQKDVTSFGLYSFFRYQLAKRWFAAAMYDYSEFPEFSNFHHQAFSGILQYFTTEFQKFELQYRINEGDFFDTFSDFRIRAVFVIGAHGAHQY
ncbi:MAG: hypothetical protein ACE5HO_20740 [bacterium]